MSLLTLKPWLMTLLLSTLVVGHSLFVTFYIGGRAFSLLLLSTLVVGHSLFCYFLHWW